MFSLSDLPCSLGRSRVTARPVRISIAGIAGGALFVPRAPGDGFRILILSGFYTPSEGWVWAGIPEEVQRAGG